MDSIYYVDVYMKEYSIEWMIYNYGFMVPMFIIIVACLIASDYCENKKGVVLEVVLWLSIIMPLSLLFLRDMIYDKYKDVHNAGRYCADPRFSESELCRAVEVEAIKKGNVIIYEFKYMPSNEQIKQMSAVVQRQEELNKSEAKEASALKQEMIRDRGREIAKIPVVKQ